MRPEQQERVFRALDQFQIDLPSWGFANTGTRFGKFLQAAAATTLEEKLSDAGQVHALTGSCPTVALHVLWDLPNGVGDTAQLNTLAAQYGVQQCSRGLSIRICFRIRFISMARLRIRMRACAARRSIIRLSLLCADLRCQIVRQAQGDGRHVPEV
jgi:L-rhamnose isomerase/sugar isomerase